MLIVKWTTNREGGSVFDWIHLVQNAGKWRALVKMKINLLVPQNPGNLLTSQITIKFSKKKKALNYSASKKNEKCSIGSPQNFVFAKTNV
jgi:hypothetical protein